MTATENYCKLNANREQLFVKCLVSNKINPLYEYVILCNHIARNNDKRRSSVIAL